MTAIIIIFLLFLMMLFPVIKDFIVTNYLFYVNKLHAMEYVEWPHKAKALCNDEIPKEDNIKTHIGIGINSFAYDTFGIYRLNKHLHITAFKNQVSCPKCKKLMLIRHVLDE